MHVEVERRETRRGDRVERRDRLDVGAAAGEREIGVRVERADPRSGDERSGMARPAKERASRVRLLRVGVRVRGQPVDPLVEIALDRKLGSGRTGVADVRLDEA